MTRVPSPCTGLCRLDEQQCCVGCLRTRDEIAVWSGAGESRQEEILAAVDRRRVAKGHWLRVPRDGMTLVELLVVMAILSLLMGLLLPAVQAAREAARQASCKNNLKQVGIALHAYHDVHRAFPLGCLEWRGWQSPPSHRQFAWSAMLLPQLEQGPLHNEIDFGFPYDHPRNTAAANTRVATFLCPSSPERSGGMGPTDYGGLYGERLADRRSKDGVFLYDELIRFRDIRDGLSNTMGVAEDVGGPNAYWIDGGNVFEQAFGVNDPQAPWFDNEIRSVHPGGAMVLFVDGRVHFLTESVEHKLLGALITRAGSEVINGDY